MFPPVRHGDVYELVTTDPDAHPLPSVYFLQLQYGMHKILAGMFPADAFRPLRALQAQDATGADENGAAAKTDAVSTTAVTSFSKDVDAGAPESRVEQEASTSSKDAALDRQAGVRQEVPVSPKGEHAATAPPKSRGPKASHAKSGRSETTAQRHSNEDNSTLLLPGQERWR